jgi:hypothetical protein
MPRNVRNFWAEVRADGKDTPVATGPVSADGGISVTIFQRDKGAVVRAVGIVGQVDNDGALTLYVEGGVDVKLSATPGGFKVVTKR